MTKARAISWSEPRAFSAAARSRTPAPGLYASDARRCPARTGRCIRVPEASHRLYNCARCAQQVQICRRCDRGNLYCAGGCARLRRRESLRRAGRHYQRSFRGARHHAARQRAWRARQADKVTHQGSPALAVPATVSAPAIESPGGPVMTISSQCKRARLRLRRAKPRHAAVSADVCCRSSPGWGLCAADPERGGRR